jgi:hypothetical protein
VPVPLVSKFSSQNTPSLALRVKVYYNRTTPTKGYKMKFFVELNLNNEAMHDNHEVARILRMIADQVSNSMSDSVATELPNLYKNVKDINGNTVGEWKVGY